MTRTLTLILSGAVLTGLAACGETTGERALSGAGVGAAGGAATGAILDDPLTGAAVGAAGGAATGALTDEEDLNLGEEFDDLF